MASKWLGRLKSCYLNQFQHFTHSTTYFDFFGANLASLLSRYNDVDHGESGWSSGWLGFQTRLRWFVNQFEILYNFC